ncbi:MAG TPA: YceI family protein [Chthoniobacteraceae bacterium]|nr:YceI family protein [Chthoniobacteraceae bacterium]
MPKKDIFKTLGRDKIQSMLEQQYDFVLLDVLPAEFYEEAHIPGALNACVYDVNFLKQVEQLVPNKLQTIVVYSNGVTCKAAEVASKKLNAGGYETVFLYPGGIQDWKRSRNPMDGTRKENQLPPQLVNKVYAIDPEESVLQWIGRNITGAHYGTIKFLSGTIPILLRQPNKVNFVLDMTSIQDLDIQDPGWNKILVDHLKSEDFFDVEKYPTAKFDATEFKPIENAKMGTGVPNYNVTGKLTMKNITNEINFPAVITLREDGTLAAEAHFDIDRTKWNVNYGSGKLFEKLGKHLVYDFITIQLKLFAR